MFLTNLRDFIRTKGRTLLTLSLHYKCHFTAMHNGAKAKFGIAILGFSNPGGREGNFFFKFKVCYSKI